MKRTASVLAAMAAIVVSPAAHAARPAAGSVTAERLKLPAGPSSVRGLADEPGVDPFAAQLNYRVPIELPPGLGGLAPALGLAYSGALGNGPLGIGWSLAESQIRRSTHLGVPKFDSTDTLELTGFASGRLVALSPSEYRVEGLGQTVRVRVVGSGFEVDDGSGVRYKFGVSAAAREERDATHALVWRLEEQTNLHGERIRYEYTRDRGQLYLSRITWGPSDAYRVDLTYEARTDVVTSYREGFRVETAQRLAAIRVTAFGVERRAYQLAYDATFPVARLSGVTSTGRGGNGAWPALSFTYASPAAPAITPVSGIGNWRLNASGTTLVDLDGDGAAELLQLASGGHSYLTNDNGSFGGLQPISGNTQSIAAVQLQDIDGDGRVELLQDTGNGWAVYKFSRTQWLSQAASLPNGVWPGSPGLALKQPTTTRFADINGDGLVDVIKWDNDNIKIHRATRTGIEAPFNVQRIGGTTLPSLLGRFTDVNGDGLDDYVVTATNRIDRFIGRGDGTFEPAVAVAYPFAGTISNPEDIELADLDRDGLLDLVRIELGTVRWFRGRADGTFGTTAVTLANPETLTTAVVVSVTDMDGNGSHDVVWSSSSGMWRMDLAGATTAGMLVRVENGLGMDVTFDYRSSHALAVEAKLAGSPWASHVPIAMPVPVQKNTALGPGETTRRINYGVRDPFWDATEQRFAGFLTTTVTTAGATAAETSTVITRYNAGTGTSRVLRGKPQVEQVLDGTGKRLSITTSTWAAMIVSGLPDVPLLRRAVLREVRQRFEESLPVRETRKVYEYDALGRVRRTVNYGRLDITGDESIELAEYADDATAWIRDLACETKVTDLAGNIASHSQVLYGDDVAVQPLCVAGKGWVRETRAWLGSESRFVTREQTTYDVNGNASTIVNGGVVRRMAYTADGLFPTEERVTIAPGRELVWRTTWDSVLGVPTMMTDPNGHTTQNGYDSLGRFQSVAVDGRAPHQVIEYDWTPPFPKTIVWTFDGALADVTARPASWTPSSKWRQTIEVANGKGEVRYSAVRLASAKWIVSNYRERDPNSRVVFAGRPVYTTQLELSSRPAGIDGDQLVYDPLGRLIEQRLSNGSKRTISYLPFERTTQEGALAPVHSILDGMSRPILTERSLADGTREVVEASYDAAGRLTRMTLASGAVVRDFTYDTLGRLLSSRDPDLGLRTMRYDDADRLLEETNAVGQVVRYAYDPAGRLASRQAGDLVRYHYDDARPGASNTAGRLAWVEEPTGGNEIGYDELGRTTSTRRTIDGRTAQTHTTYSASGLALSRSYDDGFALAYTYDPAGRLLEIGDLWQVVDQDAFGQPLDELAKNGVATHYTRDAFGLPTRIAVRNPSGAAIYDVSATRDASQQLTAIADLDGAGLDHTAQFTYDGFSRLTRATLAGFTFSYGYDRLHNMTSRTQTGPRALGSFTGTYRYGEGGRGPRQLTSIVDTAGAVVHQFNYDSAGRQIAEDGLALTHDPTDRVLAVSGLPGGSVVHAYGASGERVKTVAPDGSTSYFFGDGIAERNGVREHDVAIGERIVARVAMTSSGNGGGGDGAAAGGLGALALGAFGLLAALLLPRYVRVNVRARRWLTASAAALFALVSCASPNLDSTTRAVVPSYTFMHAGFAAGPAVFTDATGAVVEERRYEPFGVPIDAANVAARDLNVLNKRTESATGWSDHGARWMSPATGRWLSTDPPVVAPSAEFMAVPWALHPYQYVNQNPIAFWDPKGTCSAPSGLSPGQVGICIEAFIAADRIQLFGEGDDRGFEPNDEDASNRIQQHITVDLRSFALTNKTSLSESRGSLPGWAAVVVGLSPAGPVVGALGYRGVGYSATGGTSVRDQLIDRRGLPSTTFVAGGRGRNGAQTASNPLVRAMAPGGTIDWTFTINVNAAGDVTLVNGSHKAYPSYGVYAYKNIGGQIFSIKLREFDEEDKDDLHAPFPNGLTDKPKYNTIFSVERAP